MRKCRNQNTTASLQRYILTKHYRFKSLTERLKVYIFTQDMVKEHGADTTRLFILFKAPPQVNLEWDSKQISGQSRWLQRLWTLVKEFVQIRSENPSMFGSHDEICELHLNLKS
jgi:leucyl-tRNA synthetase